MRGARSMGVVLLGLAALSFGCSGAGMRSTTHAPTAAATAASPEMLRKNTVSVRVQAHERIAQVFQGISEKMAKEGKSQLAEFFEAQTGGSFGSGFLVKRGTETFVITNRHVVDFADEAEVALDGDEKGYPVEVVYTDAVYDLAVLAFGDTKPEGLPGMKLGGGTKDLETVIATGFPGLDGHPSYQITRGQVSNERFVGNSRGQRITLIQHTAPIDPGSSGGPLINESGAVVGVNFVKYAGRDNVYLAIPAEAVSKVLDIAVETKNGRRSAKWLGSHLGQSCGRMVGGLRRAQEPSVDVYDLITNDVVADKGFESMDTVAKHDREAWSMFFENPTTMLRIAVAMRLWREAHGKEGLPVSCVPLAQDPNDGTVKLRMTFERGDRETFWRFEQGAWKLVAFDKMTSNAKTPAKPTGRTPVKPRGKKK